MAVAFLLPGPAIVPIADDMKTWSMCMESQAYHCENMIPDVYQNLYMTRASWYLTILCDYLAH